MRIALLGEKESEKAQGAEAQLRKMKKGKKNDFLGREHQVSMNINILHQIQ